VGELVRERADVLLAGEIAALITPAGDGVDHPADQLAYALLPIGRSGLAAEVLRDDHVGRHLRPPAWNIHVGLFEDDLTVLLGDGRRALLPFELVVGVRALLGESPLKLDFFTLRRLARLGPRARRGGASRQLVGHVCGAHPSHPPACFRSLLSRSPGVPTPRNVQQ